MFSNIVVLLYTKMSDFLIECNCCRKLNAVFLYVVIFKYMFTKMLVTSKLLIIYIYIYMTLVYSIYIMNVFKSYNTFLFWIFLSLDNYSYVYLNVCVRSYTIFTTKNKNMCCLKIIW